MPGPTVINIKEATFKLADDVAGLTATGKDFTCQITSAAVTAAPSLQTVPATFCAAESQSPSATGFSLDLTWLQDWGATDSLSQYAWDNDATKKAFSITPVDPDAPAVSGEVWVVAGSYLGDAGTPLVASGTWPLPQKPTIAPAAGLFGAGGLGTEGQGVQETTYEGGAEYVPEQQAEPQPV